MKLPYQELEFGVTYICVSWPWSPIFGSGITILSFEVRIVAVVGSGGVFFF